MCGLGAAESCDNLVDQIQTPENPGSSFHFLIILLEYNVKHQQPFFVPSLALSLTINFNFIFYEIYIIYICEIYLLKVVTGFNFF